MEQINDTWQVMVEGQVYETDLDGLVQWYMEGCFHPQDKVKKGNRNWIEAWRVPQLQRIFNSAPGFPASSSGQQPSVTTTAQNQQQDFGNQVQAYHQPENVQSQNVFQHSNYSIDRNSVSQNVYGISTHTTVYDKSHQNSQHHNHENQNQTHQNWQAPPSPAYVTENCVNHPQFPAKYICRSCSSLLCNDCPKKMGMSVFICTNCGAMCDLFEQIKKKNELAFRKSQGFGLEDLGQALAYPFKFPASLVGGVFLYAIFMFGGIIGYLIAKMLLFGCIVVIIRQVAWGRMQRNFISEIGENGILDDLIKPGFLGFGVTLVSWGPMILGFLIAIYMVLSMASTALQQQALPENQPRTNFELQAGESNNRNTERLYSNDSIQSKRDIEKHPAFDDEENPMQSKKSGGTLENNYLSAFLAASIPLILLIVIGALWGFFYYPMALAIAGYTQDFLATINPLVGIDTMKRMGGTYFKAFGMYVVVSIIGFGLGIFVYVVTIPFNSPFGNIPKNLLDGAITFYTSMVIACLLGLALFKCSDKLGIETD